MQKRNLFEKMFGKKQPIQTGSRFELLKNANSTFYAWSGKIFENDIVRSCIRPKANAIGKLSPKHIVGFNEKMKINQVPYIRNILENPNPYMSMQDMLMKLTYQRELTHNAFAYIKRDDKGNPLEVYPIPYSSIELLKVGDELYAKFSFWNGQKMSVPYTDLIHLRKDFSDNDFFGESGTNALNNIMEVINTTDQSVVNAIKNSAVIKWIMKFKNTLRPEDVELQIKEFTKNYLDISNTGGAAASDPRYDLEQVEDKSYVPNSSQMDKTVQRLYSYFGVNEKIVQNKYTEDEWNAFYESEIEPIAIQLSNTFTRAFFSRTERGHGNKIVFEASNLAYASMKTKLNLVQMVDRGMMTPNEVRRIMNLGPIEGGNDVVRRLDTAKVEVEKEDEKDDNEGQDV